MKNISLALIILISGIMLPSCISKKKFDEAAAAAAAEKAALEKQLDDSHAAKDKLQGEYADLQKNLNMSQEEVSNLGVQLKKHNEKIGRLQSAISDAFAGYDNVQTERRGGRLYIKVSNDILYRPGRDKIEKDSDGTIATLAGIFKTAAGLSVMVEGHTDSDPLKIHRSKFKDNWALSAARATSVVRALEANGVAANRLTASGRGHTQPVAANDTKENKALNRRTEFIVYPDSKIDNLYQFYETEVKGKSMN